MTTLTCLVYLSLVLNESFSYVSFVYSITYISIIYFPYYNQITSMYPFGQIIICTNGYLEDLTIYLLFLAHLSYLFFWLNESLNFYCLLSVLTLLVCLDTVPNECISSDIISHIQYLFFAFWFNSWLFSNIFWYFIGIFLDDDCQFYILH